MMGERRVMQEALFYGFSLERHVPDNHLLRRIDRFVDLSEVRTHLEPYYSETGRPSIDPELMIRMLIVGYGFGIRSERRLCEEVHLNLAYRWFCRLGLDGDVPDHSTFSKVNRHGRFRESDLLSQAVRDGGGALHEGRDRGRRGLCGRRQHYRGRRPSPARRRQDRGSRSDVQSGGHGISFRCWMTRPSVARRRSSQRRFRRPIRRPATPLQPMPLPVMLTLRTITSSIWKHAVIMDVEGDDGTIRQAEVSAAKTMLDRTAEQFDPDSVTLGRRMGATARAEMVGWLVDERGIEPHVNLIDKSERTDGTFSRSDFTFDTRTRPLCLSRRYGVAENIAARSPRRARVRREGRRDPLSAPLNTRLRRLRAQFSQVLPKRSGTQNRSLRS